jgi:predicted ABC-type sugar transport system permease subunit
MGNSGPLEQLLPGLNHKILKLSLRNVSHFSIRALRFVHLLYAVGSQVYAERRAGHAVVPQVACRSKAKRIPR